jgi:hypothetical protein
MIARSDLVPLLQAIRGDEVHGTSALRFDSPDDCPGTANRWGAKAEPSVSHPGGFAVNAHKIGKVIYPNKLRRVRLI